MDRARVGHQVEDPALRPAVVKDALGVLQVVHGARLAVAEGPEGQAVALVVVEHPDLHVRHIGPKRGLGLAGLPGGLLRCVEDGQADGRVGAGVLPSLQYIEVQGPPDDPEQRGGRASLQPGAKAFQNPCLPPVCAF